MKSQPEPADVQYLFGPFSLDLTAQQLTRGDQPITLPTRKAFDALVLLVEQRHRVVGKDELMATVWRDAFVSDDSLTQCISMIRRALEDDPAHPKYVATIPRKGYRFVSDVTVTPEPHAVAATEAAAPPESIPIGDTPRRVTSAPWKRWAIAAGLLLTGGLLAQAWPRPELPVNPIRLFHAAPPDTTLTSGGVLSPDGRNIAFVARSHQSGLAQLWVRALDTGEARALPGTDRAARPFWAPDSHAIAFFSDGKLRRIDLQPPGGVVRPPAVITSVGYAPAGGSWGSRGEIVFATRTSSVQAVSSDGGHPRPVTTLDAATGDVAHRWPQFLPDGRHFLYVAQGTSPASSTTYVASLDEPDRIAVLEDAGSPVFFAAPNYLLYVRDRVLMAQRFDLGEFRLDGAPVAITANVAFPTITNGGVVSAAHGLLAIWGGPADHRLSWFTRSGDRDGAIDAPTALHNPEFSPDHRQLLAQGDGERPGIWLIDLERGAPLNVAPEGMAPAWSPAGDEIVFAAATPNGRHVRVRQVRTRTAADRVLRVEPGNAIVADWSVDGRHLLYSVAGTGGSRDVWVLPMDGDDAAYPYLRSPANEVQSRIAPDGEWVAYASDESGTWEVYVESFPVPGARRVISVGGGAEPQWRRDGKELFYVASDGTMMAVDIASGKELGVGRPKPLFRAPLSGDISSYRNRYAVTADGQRFLIDATDRPELPPLEIIVNWTSLLAR